MAQFRKGDKVRIRVGERDRTWNGTDSDGYIPKIFEGKIYTVNYFDEDFDEVTINETHNVFESKNVYLADEPKPEAIVPIITTKKNTKFNIDDELRKSKNFKKIYAEIRETDPDGKLEYIKVNMNPSAIAYPSGIVAIWEDGSDIYFKRGSDLIKLEPKRRGRPAKAFKTKSKADFDYPAIKESFEKAGTSVSNEKLIALKHGLFSLESSLRSYERAYEKEEKLLKEREECLILFDKTELIKNAIWKQQYNDIKTSLDTNKSNMVSYTINIKEYKSAHTRKEAEIKAFSSKEVKLIDDIEVAGINKLFEEGILESINPYEKGVEYIYSPLVMDIGAQKTCPNGAGPTCPCVNKEKYPKKPIYLGRIRIRLHNRDKCERGRDCCLFGIYPMSYRENDDGYPEWCHPHANTSTKDSDSCDNKCLGSYSDEIKELIARGSLTQTIMLIREYLLGCNMHSLFNSLPNCYHMEIKNMEAPNGAIDGSFDKDYLLHMFPEYFEQKN